MTLVIAIDRRIPRPSGSSWYGSRPRERERQLGKDRQVGVQPQANDERRNWPRSRGPRDPRA
jgi:hypothetical protein